MAGKKRVVKNVKDTEDLLSETCEVALTEGDMKVLDRICKVDERSRSFVLRKALREYHDRWGR